VVAGVPMALVRILTMAWRVSLAPSGRLNTGPRWW
jgi:hypothetical protein